MAIGRVSNFSPRLGRHRAFVDFGLRPAHASTRALGLFRRFRVVLAHQLVAGADNYQRRRRHRCFAGFGFRIINCCRHFHRGGSRAATDDLRDFGARQKLVDAVAAGGGVDIFRLFT